MDGEKGFAATLRKRLEFYRRKVTAIEEVLSDMNGYHIEKKQQRGTTSVLAEAVQLDAARRLGTKSKGKGTKGKQRRAVMVLKKARKPSKEAHQRSIAAFLAHFDNEPRPAKGLAGARGRTGTLVQSGYLRRVADGFVRTEKPYPPM